MPAAAHRPRLSGPPWPAAPIVSMVLIVLLPSIAAADVTGELTFTDPDWEAVGRNYWPDATAAYLELIDADLDLDPGSLDSHFVSCVSALGDSETVFVTETEISSGVFRGTIPFDVQVLKVLETVKDRLPRGDDEASRQARRELLREAFAAADKGDWAQKTPGDGLLQLAPGDWLAGIYQDEVNGYGEPYAVRAEVLYGGIAGWVSGTWTAAEGPYYLIGDVTVPCGETLRIESGTAVRLAPYASLQVYGTLECVGVLGDSVSFDLWQAPDTHPDDIWGGIYSDYYFDESCPEAPGLSFSYATFRRGGSPINAYYPDHLAVDHSLFTGGGQQWGYGAIYVQGAGDLLLSHDVIRENSDQGLVLSDCSGSVEYCEIADNGDRGCYISAYERSLTVSHTTVTGHRYGLTVDGGYDGLPVIHDCSLYDNTNYDLISWAQGELDARYNWWGEATTAEMNEGGNPKDIAKIRDYFDDDQYGMVNYGSWVGSAFPAGVSGELAFLDSDWEVVGRNYWPDATAAYLELIDADLDLDPGSLDSHFVSCVSALGDTETVFVTETEISSGVFRGTIPFDVQVLKVLETVKDRLPEGDDEASRQARRELLREAFAAADKGDWAEKTPGDGLLQLAPGDWLAGIYQDEVNGYGEPYAVRAEVLYGGIAGWVSGTWTAAEGPYYLIGDVTVPCGETLRIESGTAVRLAPYASLRVYGTLECVGVLGDSVSFDLWQAPDTHPDDIWGGIYSDYYFDESCPEAPGLSFSYATFRRGGSPINAYYPDHLAVDHSLFTGGGQQWGYGAIYVQGAGDLLLSHDVIRENSDQGIVLSDCSGSVEYCEIADNGDRGCYISAYERSPTVSHTTVTGHRYGLTVDGGYDGLPVIHDCSLYDNTDYDLFSWAQGEIDARYNWWGEATTAEMNEGGNPKDIAKIWDYFDNDQYGMVNYSSWKGASYVDLEPLGLDAPVSAVMGETVPIDWSAVNNGPDTISRTFHDRLWLSVDAILDDLDIPLAEVTHVGDLDSAQTYAGNVSVVLPPLGAGDYHFIIEVDGLDEIFERSGAEANNWLAAAHATALSVPPHPDLQVTALAPPASGFAGEQALVTYTVGNLGDGSATGGWEDAIYLSDDPVVGGDVLLDVFTYENSLAPAADYQHSHPVTLPPDAEGSFWIVVVTDVENMVEEYGYDDNNARLSATSFSILPARYPDLIVQSLSGPSIADAGATIPVEWVVSNIGQGATNSSIWYDRIFLSRGPTLADGYVVFWDFPNPVFLPPGGFYPRSQNMTLPGAIAGDFYLIAKVDARGHVNENLNENNNYLAATSPISIRYETALLDVSFIEPEIPPYYSGQLLHLTWAVKNVGQDDFIPGGEWEDAVALSPDRVLDASDVLLEHSLPLSHSTPLSEGESDTVSFAVRLPVEADGGYHLFVIPNVHGVADVSGIARSDSIVITQAPPPDLAVAAITAPILVYSGEELAVEWTVANQTGGVTAANHWTDAFFLSTVDSLLPGATPFAAVAVEEYLGPAGQYTLARGLPVPSGLPSGIYYLILCTDYLDEVFEGTNEDNNCEFEPVAIEVIQTVTDLQVIAGQALDPAASGQSTRVTWQVRNFGDATASPGVWKDRVYVSLDESLDETDSLAGEKIHSGTLAPGSSYVDTLAVVLPNGLEGPFYLIVCTDIENAVTEIGAESNNCRAWPIEIQLTPPPDLQVTVVAAPDTVWSGRDLPVQWGVSNYGEGPTTSAQWVDAVYLSQDDSVSVEDVYLGPRPHVGALTVGGSYVASWDFPIPDGLAGSYFVIVCTDREDGVYEHQDEDNNCLAWPVRVELTPPPDFQVTHLSAPEAVLEGEPTSVQYFVKNLGSGATPAGSAWKDRLYLSVDQVLEPGQDILLGTFSHQDGQADLGYLADVDITIPAGLSGTRHLFAQTDALDEVYEHDHEDNNSRALQVNIVLRPPQLPDLVAVGLAVPDTIDNRSVKSATIQWTVRNDGAYAPPLNQSYWQDWFYLSADDILVEAQDQRLNVISHTGGLEPGASYTRSSVIEFPDGVAGTYHLFVKTDGANQVEEDSPANNAFGVPVFIDLKPVDLQVTQVQAPALVVSGQPTSIKWTVANNGLAATEAAGWYDGVYLSYDRMLDSTDKLLNSRLHTGLLGAGESYEDSTTVEIDLGISNYYFVIVHTDKNNAVYEHLGEGNNSRATDEAMEVVLAQPADLVVGPIQIPAEATVGGPFHVEWEVQNIGANPAYGNWTDGLYLSADDIYTLDDIVLGQVMHNGGLDPGKSYKGSYQGVLNCDLPGVANGDYHVIVQTDVKNNILESNFGETGESNNMTSSIETTHTSVRELLPGIVHTDTLATGGEDYFHAQVGQDEDLKITVNCTGEYDDLMLYVAYDDIPSRIHYVSRYEVEPDAVANVPGGGPDGCYLMLFAERITGSGEYTIRVDGIDFSLSTIEPHDVGNAGFATLMLTGGQLADVVSVTLDNGAKALVESWRIDPLSSAQVEAHFDLRGVAIGSYDVRVVTSEPDTSVLTDGVHISLGSGAGIVPQILGPSIMRLGYTSDYFVSLENTGDADAYDVVCALMLSAGTPYSLLFGDAIGGMQEATAEPILLVSDFIPVGGQARFTVRLQAAVEQDIQLQVVPVHSDAELVAIEIPVAAAPGDAKSILRGITTEYAGLARASFREEMRRRFFTIDAAIFADIFDRLWIEACDHTSSELLADKLRDILIAALIELDDPGIPPPQDPLVAAALDFAIGEVKDLVVFSSQTGDWYEDAIAIGIVVAWDPNEKRGRDRLDEYFMTAGEFVPFTLFFENDSTTANVPAQNVQVVDFIDNRFEGDQFYLGTFAFGDTTVEVPPDMSEYHRTIVLTPELKVKVDASYEPASGQARWIFQTLGADDRPPDDDQIGFLPPNDESGRGRGYVSFRIRSQPDLAIGEHVPNTSTIIFDLNDAITTNAVTGTVNSAYPDLRCKLISLDSEHWPPMEGDAATILALIENKGTVAADDVKVSVYHGYPADGQFIAQDISIPTLAGGTTVEVDADWSLARLFGNQTISVVVDPDSLVTEADKANNIRSTIIPVSQRSFTLHLRRGTNLVSLPLQPDQDWDAGFFAQMLGGATMIVRVDGNGFFESFIPADPSGDPFPVQGGQGYICQLPAVSNPTLMGITHQGEVTLKEGLSAVSLPLQPPAPLTARQFAERLSVRTVVRYNVLAQNFEAFVPDFHAGDGFEIAGGTGYIVSGIRDTTVAFEGSGWLGEQTWTTLAQKLDGADLKDGRAATVFGLAGRIMCDIPYKEEPEPLAVPGRVILVNTRTGAQSTAELDEHTGHFSGALLDFSNLHATRANDIIRLTVEKPNGDKLADVAEYSVSAADVERGFVLLDNLVLEIPPMLTRIEPGFPNPFNPATTIRFQLARAGETSLKIFDVRGRLVKTLVDKKLKPGYYQEIWWGDDNRGRKVASGVYMYKFVAGDYARTHKLVMVK